MAADVGAARIGRRSRSARCRPRSGSVRRWDRSSAATVAQVVGLRQAFFVTSFFYVVALVLVFTMYKEPPGHAAPGKAKPGASAFATCCVRELRPADRGRLRTAVRRSKLRAGAAAVSSPSLGRRSTRCRSCRASCSPSRPEAARLATICAAGFCSRASTRAVIAGSAAVAAAGISGYIFAGGIGLLLVGTPIFGLAIGVATTAAYTSAAAVIPPAARGAGFGLLSTGSLAGLAISPVVCGLFGHVEPARRVRARHRRLAGRGWTRAAVDGDGPVEPTAPPAAEEMLMPRRMQLIQVDPDAARCRTHRPSRSRCCAEAESSRIRRTRSTAWQSTPGWTTRSSGCIDVKGRDASAAIPLIAGSIEQARRRGSPHADRHAAGSSILARAADARGPRAAGSVAPIAADQARRLRCECPRIRWPARSPPLRATASRRRVRTVGRRLRRWPPTSRPRSAARSML